MQFSDLLSLEPIDNNLRPMRLNNRLWRPTDYSEEQITAKFKYLRQKIIDCLKEINFKLVAREVNISQLNQSIFNEGKEDLFDDEVGPTDDEWTSYYQYLTYLRDKILVKRREFIFENSECLMINKQKSSFELYLMRNKEKKGEIRQIKDEELEKIMMGGFDCKEIIQTCTNPIKQVHFENIAKINDEYKSIQEMYKEVKQFLHLKNDKIIGTKHIKVCKREKLAYDYLQIFKEAMDVINYKKTVLKTIWNFIGEEPFEMYVNYTITPTRQAFSQRNRLNSIWRKYMVCETGKTSIFSTMERIKINNLCLNKCVNLNPLLNNKYVLQVFCLNDYLELFGDSQKSYLSDLFTRKVNVQSILNESQYEFFHQQVTNNIVVEKFLQGNRDRYMPEEVKIKHNTYFNDKYSFIEQKLVNLQYIWRFTPSCPWFVPTYEVREYYGEKIALYFSYLGYYTKMLLPIGLCGLITNIIMIMAPNTLSPWYIVPSVIFGFIQVQWVNLMFDLWQSEEHEFAVRYGQMHCDSTAGGGQCSGFQGVHMRSLENDQMNALSYSDIKKLIRCLAALSLVFIALFCYGGILTGLFFFSDYLIKLNAFKNTILKLEVTIPAILNLILILLCDEMYDELAEELTNFENHETISDYEQNYVLKKYLLCFLSICGPLFFISFLNVHIGLKCLDDNCYTHCQYYFATIFIIQFTLNIWEIYKPKILIFLRKFGRMEVDEPTPIRNQFFEVPPQCEQLATETLLQPSKNPFDKINKFIEEESMKESYVITPERYGTVDDYMELLIQYSMISLFGIMFPMCFFIAFIWNALELQTDKIKLFNYSQRPLPIGEKSIGVFNGILETLSYASLLQNSGLMTFQASTDQDNPGFGMGSLAFFLVILNINFFLRFVENSVFAEIPFSFKALMDRHSYILHSTVDKFRGSKQVEQEDEDQIHHKPQPLYKIYGCHIEGTEHKANATNEEDYNTLSSEDELEEHYILAPEEIEKLRTQLHNKEKVNIRSEPIVADLIRHNKGRKSDWALRFKFLNAADPAVQQRSKIFYERTLRFLYKLERLSHHKRTWADDRLSLRYFFLRRSKVLIRNLDWRKMLVIRQNYEKVSQIYMNKMKKKYKVKLTQIAENPELEQNKLEKEQIIMKSTKFVEKHTWLDVRKVIYLRIQGLWFSSFRKCGRTITPAHSITRYKKLYGLYKQHEPQILNQLNSRMSVDEQFSMLVKEKKESQMKEINFKDFTELLYPIIPDSHITYTVELSSRNPTPLELLVDSKKPLWHRILTRPLAHLSMSMMNEVETQGRAAYLNELMSNFIKNLTHRNKADKLHLIRMLGSRQKQKILKIHTDTYRWLASTNSLQNPNIDAISVLIYTEVGYGFGGTAAILNNVLRFYAQRSVPGTISVRVGLVLPVMEYIQMAASDSVDQVESNLCKGYTVRSYQLEKGYFINGITMRDVTHLRAKMDLQYTDIQTMEFLVTAIKTLEVLEQQFGIFHGMLCPSSFYLVGGWDPTDSSAASYALLDVGMNYWYDNVQQQPQFMRELGYDEIWFASPEVIQAHYQKDQFQSFEPYKADIYSLGLVVLDMMTLGRVSTQLPETLKQNGGDMTMTIQQWISTNTQVLEESYPLTFNIIKEMVLSNPAERQLPSVMSRKLQSAQYVDRALSSYLYSIQEYPDIIHGVLNQYNKPKVVSTTVVRIFNPDRTSMAPTLKGSQVVLSEFLKEYLHRLNVFLRMKLHSRASETCSIYETRVQEDFLLKMAYQDARGDFILNVKGYVMNQADQIVQESERMKDVINILKYVHMKAQVLIQGSRVEEAQVLANHLQQILKAFTMKLSDAIRYQKKQARDQNNPKVLIYLTQTRQKLFNMSDNLDIMQIQLNYIQSEFTMAYEQVTRIAEAKYQALIIERDTLKQLLAREEHANNKTSSVEFKMYYVSLNFASQLTKYVSIRLMKLRLESDMKAKEFANFEKALQGELDIIRHLVGLQKLPFTNSKNQQKLFFQTLDFSTLQSQFRFDLVEYVKSLQLECAHMALTNRVRVMKVEHCEASVKRLMCVDKQWCLFKESHFGTLLEYALQSGNDELYHQVARIVTNRLSALFLQDLYYMKRTTASYIMVSHLQYMQMFLKLSHLLQYLPAAELLQISSQAIQLSEPHYAKDEYSRQVMIMALHLRLLGIQYVPTLHYSTNRPSIIQDADIKLSCTDTVIGQCRIILEECMLIKEDKHQSWSQVACLKVYKLNFIWLAMYVNGQIHWEDNFMNSQYNHFSEQLKALELSLVTTHSTFFKLELQFKRLQLCYANNQPIDIEEYKSTLATLSTDETTTYMHLAQPWICYLVAVQSYTTGVTWREFVVQPLFLWSVGTQPYFFLVAFLHMLHNAQQYAVVRNICQFLQRISYSLLMRVECGRKIRDIQLLWALQGGEEILGIAFKDEQVLVQPCLKEEHCTLVDEALKKIEDSRECNQAILVTYQAALRIINHYLEWGCNEKAVQLSLQLEAMIYETILAILQVCIPEYRSQRIFLRPMQSQLNVQQLSQIVRLEIREQERYEFVFTNDMESLEVLLEVGRVNEYNQMLQLQVLLRSTIAVLTVSQMRVGNMPQVQRFLPCMQKWVTVRGNSQFNLLILNCLLQIQNTKWEHDIAFTLSRQMIETINKLQDRQHFLLVKKKSIMLYTTRPIDEATIHILPGRYRNLEEQVNQIDRVDSDAVVEEIPETLPYLPYFQTIHDINIMGVQSLNEYKINSYLGCLECLLNDPKKLQISVSLCFAIQDLIQSLYGTECFLYARALQLTSTMYLQFCYSKQLKILEKELRIGQDRKLKKLYYERNRITLAYLEQRVNGKATSQSEAEFKVRIRELKEEIATCEEIKRGFTIRSVSRWALSAADHALDLHEKFCLRNNVRAHANMGYLNLLKSDCYLFQEKVLLAVESLETAGEIFSRTYIAMSHPDVVVLYIKQAMSKAFARKCLQSQMKTLVRIEDIPSTTKLYSILEMIQFDKNILKFFDDYRNHGFTRFLEVGLTKFFIQKNQFKARKGADIVVGRKDHQEILVEIDRFSGLKDRKAVNNMNLDDLFDSCTRSLKRDKIKIDFIGVEELTQASNLCKVLYHSYNNKLYKKVEELLKRQQAILLQWENKK